MRAHQRAYCRNFPAGYVTNVTFSGDLALVQLSAVVPSNCSGGAFGWMYVPSSYKAMQAFVIGLRMRGAASRTPVVVYTDGLANNYCQINQIDPAG